MVETVGGESGECDPGKSRDKRRGYREPIKPWVLLYPGVSLETCAVAWW